MKNHEFYLYMVLHISQFTMLQATRENIVMFYNTDILTAVTCANNVLCDVIQTSQPENSCNRETTSLEPSFEPFTPCRGSDHRGRLSL